MKRRYFSFLMFFVLIAGVCLAQEAGYQPGKVVSIHKRDTTPAKTSTDAPTKPSKSIYDISIESAGKTYAVVYKAQNDLDPTWAAEGKDVEVQVNGKTMNLKRGSGRQPVKLAIVSTK